MRLPRRNSDSGKENLHAQTDHVAHARRGDGDEKEFTPRGQQRLPGKTPLECDHGKKRKLTERPRQLEPHDVGQKTGTGRSA